MNTDCTKPSVAPKPRFVCHASLKLPPPLTAAARGPRPFIAPKPKVTLELNGNQGECSNGSLLSLDGKLNEEHENQADQNKVIADTLPVKKQLNDDILKSPPSHLWTVSPGPEGREVTEGGKEEEEDMIHKIDEDWRLIDSALTKDGNSLEALWVHDMRLTAESREPAEIIATEVTEDMDPEGCDAGEALADTDGLSVGDLSVNSIDVDAGCYAAKHQDMVKQEKLQVKDGSRADEWIEFPTNEPELPDKENMTDSDPTQIFLREATEEESGSDCGFTCNILKLRCGHKIKENGEDQQNICFDDFVPEVRKQATKRHAALDNDSPQEPVYISSEDIINRELMPRCHTAHKPPDSPLTQTRVSFLKSGKSSFRKYGGVPNERVAQELSDYNSHVLGDRLNHLNYCPSFRQVSISVPKDTDSSMTSSLSESQLLSPNDSDVFEDDLDGHIVPFLDDTTDTEQDISDEPVYEEPGKSFRSENGFPSDRKATGMQLRSLSRYTSNNMEDSGGQFTQKTYMSGFGQPALSSSPMLGAVRHKSYSKPHYLSLYPRSLSMEGQDMPLGVYKEGSPRQRVALCSSDSFSRRSPLSSSALSTPTSVVDIPPPFELSYITKKPITKSSPSLLIEGDTPDKNRKKKSSIKRFLMLKFRWKAESKPVVDVNSSSFKSSVESNHHTPSRLLDLDRHSMSSSPQLNSRLVCKHQISPDPPSTFLLYNESKRNGNSVAFLNRSVVRVESFEDRSRVPFIPLPLTKPRSISFPNTDSSDYENVPAINSDYENLQVPQRWPVRQAPYSDFFDRPSRVLSAANETDGYVDMSSLPGFEKKTQSSEQEAESAYTEAYKVCSVAVGPATGLLINGGREMVGEEDQGRTSEEEEGATDNNYDRQLDGRSRAFYIGKELLDTERLHVKALKMLQEDFREAVGSTVGDEGEPVVSDERLREILNELPDVYTLHRTILNELEDRLRHWEESPRIADIFLSRKAEFLVFTTYIGHYDRSMNLLEDSCESSPAFAAIVEQFEEQSGCGKKVAIKHQLLQVIVRVAQYRMLLTDYLNNLSPDSKEYEDTQAAVAIVSDIADQVNDSLKHGENLLRLVNIEYSVHGQRDLLQPGRFFVKEGTLMKVNRKSRQPRHLFLTELLSAGFPARMFLNADFLSQFFTDSMGKMNDVLLYTYPQQDGKYRLKNTLPLIGLKVSKPTIENVQNALKIEGTDISITLSASSFIEREDWFYTLNRTINEDAGGSAAFHNCSGEARDRLQLSLGEKAPTLVPVSEVMMCMNCTSDFSLTLRRHHCHGCGRIVCRSCSRNRYPLKYMKDRMAKVCDHCYTELKKRGETKLRIVAGGDVPALSGKCSPSTHRSTRPLSAVFQNIHPPNIWKHRKGTLTFNPMTVYDEGSIKGSLQRSKKSKRNWKKLWFLLKDKVLYTFRAQEETVASESLPLLGFTVRLQDKQDGDSETNVFQLYHKNTLFYTFKAEDNYTAQRWANAMEEATVL